MSKRYLKYCLIIRYYEKIHGNIYRTFRNISSPNKMLYYRLNSKCVLLIVIYHAESHEHLKFYIHYYIENFIIQDMVNMTLRHEVSHLHSAVQFYSYSSRGWSGFCWIYPKCSVGRFLVKNFLPSLGFF